MVGGMVVKDRKTVLMIRVEMSFLHSYLVVHG